MLCESLKDIPPTLNRTVGRLPLRNPVLEELPRRDATVGPLDGLGEPFGILVGAVVAFREPQKPLKPSSKIIVEEIEKQMASIVCEGNLLQARNCAVSPTSASTGRNASRTSSMSHTSP